MNLWMEVFHTCPDVRYWSRSMLYCPNVSDVVVFGFRGKARFRPAMLSCNRSYYLIYFVGSRVFFCLFVFFSEKIRFDTSFELSGVLQLGFKGRGVPDRALFIHQFEKRDVLCYRVWRTSLCKLFCFRLTPPTVYIVHPMKLKLGI